MREDLAVLIYEAAYGEAWAYASRAERKAARRQSDAIRSKYDLRDRDMLKQYDLRGKA